MLEFGRAVFLRSQQVNRAQSQGGRDRTSYVHIQVQRYAQKDRFRLTNSAETPRHKHARQVRPILPLRT